MIDVGAVVDEFKRRYKEEPRIASAPGRVNLIGEHTDYNDGFVLPFAIDKRTYAAFSGRSDGRVKAYTMTLGKTADFEVTDDSKGNDWAVYIRGMLTTLSRRGITTSGANLVIDSDIPFGAGLSSSAALEVAVGLAISTIAERRVDPTELALAGQEVENEFAGVRSGIMDQLVSVLAISDHTLLIDCRSLETQHVPMDLKDMSLVVCDSKVEHELASTEYNKRREECEEGVKLLGREPGEIRSLRDVTMADLDKHQDVLSDKILQRCRHVVSENERTLAAVAAIKAKDLVKLGKLMYLSHYSLRDDYEVSCPELDLLVETAASIDGVAGSRMTGGGFGGCTITLLKTKCLAQFKTRVERAYEDAFRIVPEIFEVRPSAGARVH